ncbi:uncharacterized protein LOC106731614 isoform X2 [Pelodiscus sinensis]|uniref:uncharacterized protein LOC106731614 isoform X2 n=1 Tax=Pelodiscus sinensis TaxID=13735 RepID=UPI003F6ADC15
MDAASRGPSASALPNDKILVLTCVSLTALSLSLLGSSSVLAVAALRGRCFSSQLRPLFLLSLADFLAALVLIITAAIQLLPARLFIRAYEFCPYGLMLAMGPRPGAPGVQWRQRWPEAPNQEPAPLSPNRFLGLCHFPAGPWPALTARPWPREEVAAGKPSGNRAPGSPWEPVGGRVAGRDFSFSPAQMFYAVSFLMVIVYAYEANRALRGWRVARVTAVQDRRRCMERARRGLPYVLAWLLPALMFLGQLLWRGTLVRDVAPRPLEPRRPCQANHSCGAYSLYCSSCLILIHRSQDVCYKDAGHKDPGLEVKILFFTYLLLVLGCCTFLYCRVERWCRPLSGENDGFASRNVRHARKISCHFQLVFLVCWTPALLLSLLSFTSVQPTAIFALR